MRLSEDVRECVVFIGLQTGGPNDAAPIEPKGTAFLVSGGSTFPNEVFLVTARHVAEKVRAPFVVRMNKKGGGAELVHIDRATDIEWCFHADETVDLAVASLGIPDWAQVRGINAEGMLHDAKDIETVGAGDTVCVVGLFHLVHGSRRNLPITHVGHVALLPGDERIPVGEGDCEGFLVQANAISGCSGSPVFVSRQRKLAIGGHSVIGLSEQSTMLGVWSSSWKVKGSEIATVEADGQDAKGNLAPLGMGVVVPLQKLIDILWGAECRLAAGRFRAARFAVHRQAPFANPG